MRKVSIIGAGNVGATAAMNIARMNFVNEVVLLDIKEGVAEGKAMDIFQCARSLGFNTNVVGSTNDYSKTAKSDVIVITSGMARKPGMTREDLVGINSRIMKSVVENCYLNSPDAVYIIVSNPLDAMTYQAMKILEKLGMPDAYKRVFGMGGILDSSRFTYFIKNMLSKHDYDIPATNIHAWVIGMHSDTHMIPLIDTAYFVEPNTDNYIMVKDVLSNLECNEIVERTKRGGATLTELLGTSAWEAPAACIASTVEAIITRERKFMPCSIYRSEYDCCIGTLSTVGPNGIEKIYSVDLMEGENVKNLFNEAVKAVKNVNDKLPKD